MLAWISYNRRLARDFERYARSVGRVHLFAMLRRLTTQLFAPES
jgi:hypothetical protein